MKHLSNILIVLSTLTAFAADLKELDMQIGSELFYTRFHQGCPCPQKGFLSGPTFNFRWTRPWRIYLGVFFDGLWKIGHICSRDGIFIDSNQYEALFKIGVPCINNNETFIITPHLGLDFLHFFHKIENCIVTYRYNSIAIPMGFEFSHLTSEHFYWQLRAYYRLDAYTRLKVETPCAYETTDCKIKLKRAHGIHLELPLSCVYRAQERVSIILQWSPTFDWQKFSCADPCDCKNNPRLPIPELKSWKLGTKAIFGINF